MWVTSTRPEMSTGAGEDLASEARLAKNATQEKQMTPGFPQKPDGFATTADPQHSDPSQLLLLLHPTIHRSGLPGFFRPLISIKCQVNSCQIACPTSRVQNYVRNA